MTNNTDISTTNITIYRLDIYRLLTLLLADKQIANNSIFRNLGNDNFDNEVNRLLILVAAVTRRLLDNTINNFKDEKCGDFWYDYPKNNPNKLTLYKACSMVIHATDIIIKPLKYYSKSSKTSSNITNKGLYFQDKITIIGENKMRAEINLQKFAQYCIKLSDEITKEENHAN